jgi:hypothetical protein
MAVNVGAADHRRMRRSKREYWAGLVAELERSGERQREFAAKRRVKLCTLRHWLYRIRRERERDMNDASRILPVRVVASTAPSARAPEEKAAIEVLLVRFPSHTAADLIAEVVTRLRQC